MTLKQLYFVSGFKFFSGPKYRRLIFSWTSFIAKKICEYKNGCSYLATHNCHMCSRFHCDLHVSLHFDESRKIDLRKNELQWLLFAAWEWIYLWQKLSEVLIMKSEANILVLLINFNRLVSIAPCLLWSPLLLAN